MLNNSTKFNWAILKSINLELNLNEFVENCLTHFSYSSLLHLFSLDFVPDAKDRDLWVVAFKMIKT